MRRALVPWLKTVQRLDRLRLRWLGWCFPGLEIHPEAASAFAVARFVLAPGASVRIGRGAVTERIPGALHVYAEAGAEIEVEEGVWLRTEVGPLHLVAFAGARLSIGREALLNACHVSAKRRVRIGYRSTLGIGSRVFDADQHDLDSERPETVAPVAIGDHVWIASDVTVLRGVSIGDHSVIGTRSLVGADVPPHTLAYGVPARPQDVIGDRSKAR